MPDERVSLEHLARQIRGMRDDVHALKDDLGALTVIVRRFSQPLPTIRARDAEFRENYFWRRERSPAAPPLASAAPASDGA